MRLLPYAILWQLAGLAFWIAVPVLSPAATTSGAPTPPPPPLADSATGSGGSLSRKAPPPPPTHEELLKMAPEEREARLKLLRDRKVQPLKDALTPAEREKRRQEIRQRLEKRLEILRKRKKERPLSAEEEKQLRRLEEVSSGFQVPKKGKGDPSATPTLETR